MTICNGIYYPADNVEIQQSSFWGLNGLYIPQSNKSKSIPRSRSQTTTFRQFHLILVFSCRGFLLSDAVEIITDGKDFQDFLFQCSSKFNFNGPCRKIFSSQLQEISDLTAVLEDNCSWVWNPQGRSRVYGPVWATMSEEIDPDVIKNYFRHTVTTLQTTLKQKRDFLKELEAMAENRPEDIQTSSIKSYSKKELKFRTEEVQEDVYRLEESKDNFLEKYNEVKECGEKVKVLGYLCAVLTPITQCSGDAQTSRKDIRAFSSTKGLRMKVFVNGHSCERTFNAYFNMSKAQGGERGGIAQFNMLLDCLSSNGHVASTNDNARGILVRRLFTEKGKEICSLPEIHYDQKICVSFGEDWIPLQETMATAKLHIFNDELKYCKDYELTTNNVKSLKPSEKRIDGAGLENLAVLEQDRGKKLVVGTVSMETALLVTVSVAASRREWLWTRDGRMVWREVPHLCLSMAAAAPLRASGKTTQIVEEAANIADEEQRGLCEFAVVMAMTGDNHHLQTWEFTKSALLRNKAYPEYCLTYMEAATTTSGVQFGLTNLVTCYRDPDEREPPPANQRWALRSRQWRECDLPSPEWHRLALTWPIAGSDGLPNQQLQWPIHCSLVCAAPPTPSVDKATVPRFPRKLLVSRNGDHKKMNPILVLGPDMSKILKKNHPMPEQLHCLDETIIQIEFEMFLDTCTSSLRLHSAARRLFKESSGKELFDLCMLDDQDRVLVSVGESWSSPALVASRLDRRSKVNKTAVDVERLRCFVSLNEPPHEGFVLGFRHNQIEDGASLELQQISRHLEMKLGRLRQPEVRSPSPVSMETDKSDIQEMSFHERHCDAARSRLKVTEKTEPDAHSTISDIETTERSKFDDSVALFQQFDMKYNYIAPKMNSQLFLFAEEVGKPIVLKKKEILNKDDRFKWIFHSNGAIESQYHRGFVMSVSCRRMLPFEDKADAEFAGSQVFLEAAQNAKYGKVHQRFKLEHQLGIIWGLASSQKDHNIYAAILSGICTQFSCPDPISQPAFEVTTKNGMKLVCQACVTILNGRYPTKTVEGKPDTFICCYRGGFKVVPASSVDLSLENAGMTYQSHVTKLESMRRQLLIQPCRNRTEPIPPMIRVWLYLNGHGRKDSPHFVSGPSIGQIMETAARVKGLHRAVRVLYTSDGSAVVDDTSYRNFLSGCNNLLRSGMDNQSSIGNSELAKTVSIPLPVVSSAVWDENSADKEEDDLKINLSDDRRFFFIEFNDRATTSFFEFTITISTVSNIDQFVSFRDSNVCLLINYEIFEQQVNSSTFRSEDEFQSSDAKLTLSSSVKALIKLFSKELQTIQLQLVLVQKKSSNVATSFTNSSSSSGSDEYDHALSVLSIEATAVISLKGLAAELMADSSQLHLEADEGLKNCADAVFYSTDTFQQTMASVSVNVSLKQVPYTVSGLNGSCKDDNSILGDGRHDNRDSDYIVPLDNDFRGTLVRDEVNSVVSGSLIVEPRLPLIARNDSLVARTTGALSVPIVELWVSQGEQFHWPPDESAQNTPEARQTREQMQALKAELDSKKLLLRTLKGERLKNCDPGVLEPTPSELNPVQIKGSWQFPTRIENNLSKDVDLLQAQMKSLTKHNPVKKMERELYKQKHLKQCFVRRNGESDNSAIPVWGETVYEVMENAVLHFKLKKKPVCLYNGKGDRVESLRDVLDPEVLTLSCGDQFISTKHSQLQTEVRANWGRARRQYGCASTELEVRFRPNTLIDVDPFEVPVLLRHSHEVPSAEPKSIFVFENGQSVSTDHYISGRTLHELLRKAKASLGLDLAVKCFYTLEGKRICSFKEILYDDRFAASVSGKGYIKYEA